MNESNSTIYTLRKSPIIRTLIWIAIGIITVGLSVAFTLRIANKPEIISLNPPVGSPGDLVVIKGKYFGLEKGDSYVEFGGSRLTSSSYISWTDTEIKVVLPANVQEGLVFVGTKKAKSKPSFFANKIAAPIAVSTNPIDLIPVITVVSPSKVYTGTLLTISGNNFGTTRDRSQIFFSVDREKNANVDESTRKLNSSEDFSFIEASESDFDYEYWSDNEIRVRVPDGASSGNIFIKTSKGSSPARNLNIDTKAGNKSYISPKTYVVQVSVDVEESSGDKDSSIILRCPRPVISSSQPSVQLTEYSPEPVIADFQNTVIHQMQGAKNSFGKKRFIQNYAVTVYETRTNVSISRLNPKAESSPMLKLKTTQPDNCVPSNDKTVIDLAKKIIKDEKNVYNIAALIYNYMVKEFVVLKDVRKGNISPVDLIRTKKGDAYDFAIIYAALLRSCGISALPDSGIIVGTDLKALNHWWCEFYLPGFGWIPVDPALGAGLEYHSWQKGIEPEIYYFGNLDSQHILFSRGWNEIKPTAPNNKSVQRPRSYSLQSIWEEASGEKIKYSSYWADPIIIGVY